MEKLKDSEGNVIIVFKRYFIPKNEVKYFTKNPKQYEHIYYDSNVSDRS